MSPRSIHLGMTHVHAADTWSATTAASTYIRDCKAADPDDLRTIDRALAYIRATGRHREDGSRVAATGFVCRGSHSRQAVWRQIDDAFRTKTGVYSRRGGNNAKRGRGFKEGGTPRLAVFADGTLPYALSEEQKIGIATSFARLLVDRYGCAVEVALHKKDGFIDHAHWLISTRVVDEGGVGPVIREMNGIASKATSKTTDGWRRAAFSEFCRGEFARLLSEATGELYDARSFRRQGREETPTPWLQRGEYEARRAATSVLEDNRVREHAHFGAMDPESGRPTAEKETTPTRPAMVEPVATVPLDRSLPSSARLRPTRAPALKLGELSTPKPVVRVPARDATVDLSGLDHEKIDEAIRKAVDKDLKADAKAFIDEQRKLDERRFKAAPTPQWDWGPKIEHERERMPSTSLTKPEKREPRTPAANATISSEPVLSPLFGSMDEKEEEKRRARLKEEARRRTEAIHRAAHFDDLVESTPAFPQTRMDAAAPAAARPATASSTSEVRNDPGHEQRRPSYQPSSSAERITKPAATDPLVLRRAAIAVATLTRKMPKDLAALARMQPDVFITEVSASIQAYEQAADRPAAKRVLVERVQQSRRADLLAMITRPPSPGSRGGLTRRADRAPQRTP